MGNLSSPKTLSLRWAEVMADPTLQNLPYKIELNARGKIEMSPASNRHALLQANLAAEFARRLPSGLPLTECSVLTEIGIRVPDVAWASAGFLRVHGDSTPFPKAPEICVEIISPSNTDDEIQEKIHAYLVAGAQEVWILDEDGRIRYHDRDGKRASTAYNIEVSLPDLNS